MTKHIFVISLLIGTCLLIGCPSQKQTGQPTPDLMANVKNQTQLSALFTDLRYNFALAIKAIEQINEQLTASEKGEGAANLQGLVEFYNIPENLVSVLEARKAQFEKQNTELSVNKDVNQQALKNTGDLNNLFGQAIALLKQIPAAAEQFRTQYANLKSQFALIENIVLKDFPDSNANLAVKRSPDNPDFRKDQRLFEYLPKQIPTSPPASDVPSSVAPDSQIPATEPVDESKPPQVWRDDKGVIHMGQEPPEGVVTDVPKGPVSHAPTPKATTEIQQENAVPPSDASSGSIIWKDDKGNIHMGSRAPEGVESKRADEIELMISKPLETPAEPVTE